MVQERARWIPWPVRGSYVSPTASLDTIQLVVGQTSKKWGQVRIAASSSSLDGMTVYQVQ